MICTKDFFLKHFSMMVNNVDKSNFSLSHFFPKILLWYKWAIQGFTKEHSAVGGNSPK